MSEIDVLLSDKQQKKIKEELYELIKEEMKRGIDQLLSEKPFLKQKYMAEYLGVSVNTLKSWQKKGMPFSSIDGLVLFNKEEVIKWISEYQKNIF